MSLKRFAAPAVAFAVAMASFPLTAQPLATLPRAVSEDFVPVEPMPGAAVPPYIAASVPTRVAPQAPADRSDDAVAAPTLFKTPRKRLADFALALRDIRYVRGGHDPSTGFDCSGFVHYVFRETLGLVLPYDAPSQFHDGKAVARGQMQTGDLVFFHEGKRISHVGIYLDDGHFIHSPRPGKRVRVDSLDSSYWAKRFAGAKRPEVLG